MKKLMILTTILLVLFPTLLHSQQHKELKPLLKELDGFEADKAEGMSASLDGTDMIKISRNYSKDNAHITASIVISNEMMLNAQIEELKYQSGSERVEIEERDDYKVVKYYDKEGKDFIITILFNGAENQSGIFHFDSDGLEKDEGLKLAKEFDWGKINEKVKEIIAQK